MTLSLRLSGTALVAALGLAAPVTAVTPPTSLTVGSAPPVPVRPEVWIDEIGDYPARAQRYRLSGTASVRLFVNSRGRVSGCLVRESSGVAVLDDASCRILSRRARFEPTGSEQLLPFDHVVVWDLSRLPPPPLPDNTIVYSTQ